jgi:phosphomethylpyrimidine synthase
MTQLRRAREGVLTSEIKSVAETERVDPSDLAERVAQGRVVIPANKNHRSLEPCGIGEGLLIKVNSNIGTSSDHIDLEEEMAKLEASVEAGADTVMDLSTGGDVDLIRRRIIAASKIPLGTVPIYQAVIEAVEESGGLIHLTVDKLFEVIERHLCDGVDFITVHCGLTLEGLEMLRSQGRDLDIVSRGGSFLTTWMIRHERENPLFEYYDRLLSLAKEYDVVLSLGDSLRPGCLADSTDRAQIYELMTLGRLTKLAWEEDVQVMIEGPGHIPLHEIEMNIKLEKSLCNNAPFYVLGPLVTDIAAGHDHIACAIGGAVAGWAGADFLCYVTPSEHLSLPSVDDVREGVIATKIAAHAADIARGNKLALELDKRMGMARKALDWEKQMDLALDQVMARKYRQNRPPAERDVCTMCGKYCAIKQVKEYFHG